MNKLSEKPVQEQQNFLSKLFQWNVQSPGLILPTNLVLVRHGLSEGNAAKQKGIKIPEGHRDRHSSKYRLVDEGIQQAKAAGFWLRKNFPSNLNPNNNGNLFLQGFHGYFVSKYIRAIETARFLELPNAQWKIEVLLREKDKGSLDNCEKNAAVCFTFSFS